ncbi:MAG: hypothetical protein A2Z99_04320 [Treponema sp. GWB1_62_6]|nr:MAG: hypothetical protein A2Z99_04320 [Treponema sp. GWB1_62_6]
MTRPIDWRTYAKTLEIYCRLNADEVAAIVRKTLLIALQSRCIGDCARIADEVADDVRKELTP